MRRTRTRATGIVALTMSLIAGAALSAVAVGPSVTWDQVLTGTGGKDQLVGDSGRDRIVGLGNDDRLVGAKGSDWLQGGTGDDVLFGGGKHDQLYGGDGVDRLVGGGGRDLLVGGAGEDRLLGGDGDDTIDAAGDGAADFVSCGEGTGDEATVDAQDLVTGCETVNVTGQ